MEVVDQIVMKKLSDIRPYVRNPRKNEKTVEALCEIIPKAGFNVPIVIDENGIIVKGHARYTAAIRLGMKEVPCVISHADEDTIKLDRLADNKTSELSEWLDDNLMSELDMLNTDIDLTSLGFKLETPDLGLDFNVEQPEGESYEEKKARYEEMEKEAPTVEIVSEREIDRAKQNLEKKTEPTIVEAYKIVCPDCGKVFYVRKDNISHVAEDLVDI